MVRAGCLAEYGLCDAGWGVASNVLGKGGLVAAKVGADAAADHDGIWL